MRDYETCLSNGSFQMYVELPWNTLGSDNTLADQLVQQLCFILNRINMDLVSYYTRR